MHVLIVFVFQTSRSAHTERFPRTLFISVTHYIHIFIVCTLISVVVPQLYILCNDTRLFPIHEATRGGPSSYAQHTRPQKSGGCFLHFLLRSFSAISCPGCSCVRVRTAVEAEGCRLLTHVDRLLLRSLRISLLLLVLRSRQNTLCIGVFFFRLFVPFAGPCDVIARLLHASGLQS